MNKNLNWIEKRDEVRLDPKSYERGIINIIKEDVDYVRYTVDKYGSQYVMSSMLSPPIILDIPVKKLKTFSAEAHSMINNLGFKFSILPIYCELDEDFKEYSLKIEVVVSNSFRIEYPIMLFKIFDDLDQLYYFAEYCSINIDFFKEQVLNDNRPQSFVFLQTKKEFIISEGSSNFKFKHFTKPFPNRIDFTANVYEIKRLEEIYDQLTSSNY